MSSADAPPRRILLLANRTCNDSRLAHWVSDTDEAVTDATARLALAIEGLTTDGVTVTGHVGDARPITALEDALAEFPADLLVLSTFPPGMSHWLEAGLLQATDHLEIPVRHFTTEYGLQPS